MRKIERTTRFKRDYKREAKGRHRASLDATLTVVLGSLMNDVGLGARYRDHPLGGAWTGFRDCHIKPDLVLIYRKPDEETLELVRMGSHSELGF